MNEKRPSLSVSAQTFGGALSGGGPHWSRYTLAPATGLSSRSRTRPRMRAARAGRASPGRRGVGCAAVAGNRGVFSSAGWGDPAGRGALASCPASTEANQPPSAAASRPAHTSAETPSFSLVSSMFLVTSWASERILVETRQGSTARARASSTAALAVDTTTVGDRAAREIPSPIAAPVRAADSVRPRRVNRLHSAARPRSSRPCRLATLTPRLVAASSRVWPSR